MAKPKTVTTAKLVKLYAKHKNYAKVARIVGRHLTTVRDRIVAATK